MMKVVSFFSIFLFTYVLFQFITVPTESTAQAQTGEVIQTLEMNYPGIVAEIMQCMRKNGVVTIKVRVENKSSENIRVLWHDVKKTVYLLDEVNGKKYLVLKDASGEYIYSGDPWDISGNTSKISWFKLAAPPKEVTKITLVLPDCAPFEDLSIQDKS